MKRVDFRIYDELAEQVNEVVQKYGFKSQSEFFRYAAIDFIRREADRIPMDKTLNEHRKALRSIKSGQGLEFHQN